jgi:hypothetical protein
VFVSILRLASILVADKIAFATFILLSVVKLLGLELKECLKSLFVRPSREFLKSFSYSVRLGCSENRTDTPLSCVRRPNWVNVAYPLSTGIAL